jgi:hypothetical protein
MPLLYVLGIRSALSRAGEKVRACRLRTPRSLRSGSTPKHASRRLITFVLDISNINDQHKTSHIMIDTEQSNYQSTQMPCPEMKELEAFSKRFADRRFVSVPTELERRFGSVLGYRAAQARLAYLIQMHRQNCSICRR